MEELALHILDVVENAIAAKAKKIEILISEEIERDRLRIEIKDDGLGMDEEVRRRALDPFFTTRTSRRVGLGLSLLSQAAKAAGGTLEIDSSPEAGTTVRATFQHGHIDRQPLGNLTETILMIIYGNPGVDLHYRHVRGNKTYCFKSQWLKERFEGEAWMTPEGIQWLRKHLQEGLSGIGAGLASFEGDPSSRREGAS
ncbi:MAG: sensor histidine kinase [Desulfobacterota bacterium]|nr:sensor histidine kinase [Thermodesulfobacteriota bacterium]